MPAKEKHTALATACQPLSRYQGDLLGVGLFQGAQRLPSDFPPLDKAHAQALTDQLKLADFSGNANETALLFPSDTTRCRRLLLVGLGDKRSASLNTLRQAAGAAVRFSQKITAAKVALALHPLLTKKFDPQSLGQSIAEGALIGRYDYLDHLSPSDGSDPLAPMKITLLEPDARTEAALKKGVRVGEILAQGQNLSRAVANRPGNEITPASLARFAQTTAKKHGLTCRIFNETKLRELKMNAILAVGAGSANKPRLIVLEHKGRRPAVAPHAVIVGKAITFDSGGISLKPGLNMQDMKFDKCGGCNVIGIMAAVARLKLPLRIVGVIASAENMPSHNAYRPGDIIRTYNGKTVEVQNTDAEGRLVLADALAYAAKMKPGAILDMATLTGAIVIALGHHHAGLFGNNAPMIAQLEKAAKRSGEPIWHMPVGPEYLDQMRSKIADLKNVGGRNGGACTAAAFLEEFVDNTPWAHIDIAGAADAPEEKPYRALGATGAMVRLVTEYLRNLAK